MLFCYPGITYKVLVHSINSVDEAKLEPIDYSLDKLVKHLAQNSSYLRNNPNGSQVKLGYYDSKNAKMVEIATQADINPFLQICLSDHHKKGLPFNFSPGATNEVLGHMVIYTSETELPATLQNLTTARAETQKPACLHCKSTHPYKCLLCTAATWQHPNISCDLCKQSPIVGLRLKDFAQSDFDLCHRCYMGALTQGQPVHAMLPLPGVSNYASHVTGCFEDVRSLFAPLFVDGYGPGPAAAGGNGGAYGGGGNSNGGNGNGVNGGIAAEGEAGRAVVERLLEAFPGRRNVVERFYADFVARKGCAGIASYEDAYAGFLVSQGLVQQ